VELFASRVTSSATLADPGTPYVISAAAGQHGSVSPRGSVTGGGGDRAFTFTPDAGYPVLDVLVGGGSQGAVARYVFTGVSGYHALSVTFALAAHTITASAGAGGTISPAGAVSVPDAGSQGFTITPNSCFLLGPLTVDGVPISPASTYAFSNVVADHTIAASFVPNPAPVAPITGPPSGVVVATGTPVTLTGSFTDNAGDTHGATWTFDALPPVAGSVNESAATVSASYTFGAAGVYNVRLTVSDACGGA